MPPGGRAEPRFSPDVYLGVEEIVDDERPVVDHAVLMRRMPAERRLATLRAAASRRLRLPPLRSRGRWPPATRLDEQRGDLFGGDAGGVAATCGNGTCGRSSPSSPIPLDRRCLTRVDELAIATWTAARLLDERIARGRIVDGHGDLLADDIFCLDDGPRILDGLEFDDRLRWGDVL